ncbi:MAG: nucleotide exchange factor GrpE [Anaerolineaceae bacterium]|nr:nucleotide exchange factor GrpE [Anaerolineaceae bacterium]
MTKQNEQHKKSTASTQKPGQEEETLVSSEYMNNKAQNTSQPVENEAAVNSESAANQPKQESDVECVPLQEYAALKEELDKTQKQSKDFFEGWQRERADFSNYKKRIEREQSQLSQNLSGSIIKKYLVVLDDLDRALKTRPAEGDGAGWADGIELIYRKLQKILEAEGISRMPAENETFDPIRHEAISHEDNADHKSGEIIEVVQQGYLIGDRVLRPALVRVAR